MGCPCFPIWMSYLQQTSSSSRRTGQMGVVKFIYPRETGRHRSRDDPLSMSWGVLRGQSSPMCRWVAHTTSSPCAQELPQVPSLQSQPRTDATGGFCGFDCLLCLHSFNSSPLTRCHLLITGHAEQPHCLSDPLWPPQAWCPPENRGTPLGTSPPMPLCPMELCIASCSAGHPVGFLGHLASVEGLL